MTGTRSGLLGVACCAAYLAIASAASASPLFAVGEGSSVSWTDAIQSGNVIPVRPADGLTNAAQQFYAQQVASDPDLTNFQLVQSALTPDILVEDGTGEMHQSLVMTWDNDAPADVLNIAAWEYVYDVDPDLTKTTIDFTLYPPPGIWDVSLELIDSNGFSRGWFDSGPANFWGAAWVRPDLASAQGFDFFWNDPGFDITQVVAIRLDEAGMGGPVFPAPPVGAPPIPGWNAWDSLQVKPVPEPAAITLLAISVAAAGFTGLRGRRRRCIAHREG
jgi:hypothetical protein